jgi:hypothetical protein
MMRFRCRACWDGDCELKVSDNRTPRDCPIQNFLGPDRPKWERIE